VGSKNSRRTSVPFALLAAVGCRSPVSRAWFVHRRQIEIRSALARQKGTRKATVIFSLPLGPDLAKRLSSATAMEVTTVFPNPFRVRSPNRQAFRTIERNVLPDVARPASVVLMVRNWETGALGDRIGSAFEQVRKHFRGFGTFGQPACEMGMASSITLL
jgi:hypothetical protein